MNGAKRSITSSDFQISPNNWASEADRFLAAAIDRISAGRSDSSTGAVKTCTLLLDLLEGARLPLRRLSRISPKGGLHV